MKASIQNHKRQFRSFVYALTFLVTLLGLSFLLEGCDDTCEATTEYTYFEPVYTTLQEIRSSVDLVAPQPLKTIGKIYYKDGYLFLNEPGEGIHIIDNHDPAHPVIKNFITIPGNYDLSIFGNTLYADSYIDLVAIDIADITDVKEVNRLENIFSGYNSLGFYVDVTKGIVTNWEEKKGVSVNKSDCNTQLQPWGGIYYGGGIALMDGANFSKREAISPGNGSGVGGSMARFTINKNHLYALDVGNVQPIDVANPTNPIAKEKMFVAWDIETIFPHQDNLFIGSGSGMYILDIISPSVPVMVSTYSHVRSCDPVIVDGNYAYVTLRSGTTCQGFTNQLEVIDIQNLSSPQLLRTYPMHNPHGLGKDNSTLFICDGDDGLKVYDAANINTIDKHLLAHYKDIDAFDVIPFNNTLIMIGEDGLYQYDYSNPQDIKLLSHIIATHEN